MAAYGDENANVVNIQVDDSVKAVLEPTKPLASPGASPTRGRTEARYEEFAENPKLEPSLSAWAASRPVAAGIVKNIGASERPAQESAPDMSVSSRRSQRSASRRSLSTEEIDAIRLEQKRQEVTALMRKNERTCRDAIDNPKNMRNVASARSLDVTVPEEFHLSVSNRTARSSSRDSSRGGKGDWQDALRRSTRSKSRGRTWQPQLTVPSGPHLFTADRARSRSASSSRRSTPASTPERHGSSLSRSSRLPPREMLAVEQHATRLAIARTASASPLRRRLECASPARSRVSASPARSCSDMSMCSVNSRLSQLSRPRSLSRPLRTSEELERRQADAGKRQLNDLMRLNERNLQRVLAQPEPLNPSHRALTVPVDLEFHTERRARSRSTSVHSRSSHVDVAALTERLPLRERLAVERHVERLTTAQVLEKSVGAEGREEDARAAQFPASQAAPTEAQQMWIREASGVERAQRARVVAKSLRGEVDKAQSSRLCIFARAEDLEEERTATDELTVVEAEPCTAPEEERPLVVSEDDAESPEVCKALEEE
eukprot:CAMPEP_0183390816 /NCGR_PEP_ID=MMETSP0370-20130417/5997_1 /TAXON_ID=268820 /ORGANISM="Peridinium aciculiferum, Strain PAER-2" /LENGTH=546 /DNA_ID=CAMNT_0025570413 /DNA_START=53 /DNA_END=1693 /DNA_ORIENTATION=+